MYGLDSNTYKIINSSCTNYETLVNEMENWLSSVTNFYNNLNARYAEYPDILSGVLLPINMVKFKYCLFYSLVFNYLKYF